MTVNRAALVGPDSPTHKALSAPALLMLSFMLTTVLIPTTILNKVLFAALLGWILRLFLKNRSPRPELIMPVVAIMGIFFYGLVLAITADNDRALALQFFLAIFVLTLTHFVEYFHIDMDRASEICGKAMVLFTMLYATFALNPTLPYATVLVEWFNIISSSSTSEREFSDTATSTLALGTAPFLFVPFCIVTIRLFQRFRGSDFFWLMLYAGTIISSGARGIIVVALAFLVLAALRLASPLVRILVVIAVGVLFFIIIPEILVYTNIFSDEEVSNNVKIGHFDSYIDVLNISNGLLGEGLGSYYYSSGKGLLIQHTEITPLDMARYVGIPLATMFFIILLIPRIKLITPRYFEFIYTISFALYLVLSVTNPVLINSYGMLVVVWYWTKLRVPHPADFAARPSSPPNNSPAFAGAQFPFRDGIAR